MLTETEVNIIEWLSSAVWFGLLGGLVGLFIGAFILALRAHRIFRFMLSVIRALLPSVGIAIFASILVSTFQMALCRPGSKAGWEAPDWSFGIQAIAILIVSIWASFLTPRLLPKMSPVSAILGMVLLGAVLGAVANLYTAFDGYFVLESNARPIRQAIAGFVAGGIAVLLWRFVVLKLKEA